MCIGISDDLVESLWVRIRGQNLSATNCPVRNKLKRDNFATGRFFLCLKGMPVV